MSISAQPVNRGQSQSQQGAVAPSGRMIRLEFADTVSGVAEHHRKVWFSAPARLECVADLQFDITSKLINVNDRGVVDRVYLTYNGYTLLPDQSLAELLAHGSLIVQVKSLLDCHDTSLTEQQSSSSLSRKRRRRSQSNGSGGSKILTPAEHLAPPSTSNLSHDVMKKSELLTVTNDKFSGTADPGSDSPTSRSSLQITDGCDLTRPSSSKSSGKKRRRKSRSSESGDKLDIQLSTPAPSCTTSGKYDENSASPGFSSIAETTLSAVVNTSSSKPNSASKHIHFEEHCGFNHLPTSLSHESINTSDTLSATNVTLSTTPVRDIANKIIGAPTFSSRSTPRAANNAPAWVVAALHKKKSDVPVVEHTPPRPPPPPPPPPVPVKFSGQSLPRPPLPPTPRPLSPNNSVSTSGSKSQECFEMRPDTVSSVSRNHPKTNAGGYEISKVQKGGENKIPKSNLALPYPHLSGAKKQDQTDWDESPQNCDWDMNKNVWGGEDKADYVLDDDDGELEMGFERFYTPGKKKRPYAVIASVHENHHSTDQQSPTFQKHQQLHEEGGSADEGVLMIPVPKYFDLKVGERILYTTTKLDEENWEPVESAREEGTIAEIIRGGDSCGRLNTNFDDTQLSYRLTPSTSSSMDISFMTRATSCDSRFLCWADIERCWVLRSSKDLPSFTLTPGDPQLSNDSLQLSGQISRPEACAPDMNDFLSKIKAKRSQIEKKLK